MKAGCELARRDEDADCVLVIAHRLSVHTSIWNSSETTTEFARTSR